MSDLYWVWAFISAFWTTVVVQCAKPVNWDQDGLGRLDDGESNLEEELEVERSVREVNKCDDEEALKMLCSALVRQSWHQSKLLSQAVGRIGELDAKIATWD